MRNQQNVKVRVNSSFETICPFPIGYVYMSSNSTSPANIYGGTWSEISGGRYMRAAAAWGNGGSNTITTANMPSHRHVLGGGRAHGFYWGDLDLNVSTDATAIAGKPSGNKLGTKQQDWAATDYTGGGQHSTPLTKMFGRGTELPKEGDASCVTYNKFKSGLAAHLKGFVHSQLATSICQATRQVQQTFMVVRGQLFQIAGSYDQVVHGILQAEVQPVLLKLLIFELSPKRLALMWGRTWAWLQIMRLEYPHKDELLLALGRSVSRIKQLLSILFHFTAPVTAGTVQPSLAVM